MILIAIYRDIDDVIGESLLRDFVKSPDPLGKTLFTSIC